MSHFLFESKTDASQFYFSKVCHSFGGGVNFTVPTSVSNTFLRMLALFGDSVARQRQAIPGPNRIFQKLWLVAGNKGGRGGRSENF